MPNMMKKEIARAVETLLIEKKVQRLTVKDIVAECHITRQAFYYYFSGIPELLQWILQQKEEAAMEDYHDLKHVEERIRYWLLIAVNSKDELKKGMESNYADEIAQMVFQRMKKIFSLIVEEDEVFQRLDSFEKDFLIQYNCYAVADLIRDWTEDDSRNLDRIVHCIYLFATGKMVSACT
ncbi:MAG: TetR/AcrR family transcriptional regulator [Lachnospiraceae bacterium]|nr:TetR/AcrR family transcriptional regulator [Lachnospiraceae bacterium]